ncbi:MAG: AMP-binding protein [Pseudolysinimonas sp.]|uniref:AMP-binding protein n=1 Tax=Pseudolysinimonas sp. TaxID=2680009 RepID=UPI003265EC54
MRPLRVVPPGPTVLAELRSALAAGDAILVGEPSPDLPAQVEQRIALVVETSGSTGRPKRVALSADAVLANAAASESALGGPGQWVLALPTHYIAGLNVLARSLAAGTEPVVVEGDHFSAAGFIAAAQRLTSPDRFTSLVPAQLATVLDDPSAVTALQGFRAVLVGGQAAPATLLTRAAAHGVRVVRSYGSSETSGGCVYDGVPLASTTVRVVDGEVQLAGPSLAEGYLGDEQLTTERFIQDDGMRWFRTADAGTWEAGRLSIAGRRDDVIISGGLKVSLGAIETALHELPGFDDAVVVAGQDEKWGQVPVAFTSNGGVGTAPAIVAIETLFGPAARPRFVVVASIPLLPSGKPDRASLSSRSRQ